jgi:hypothetical protein
MRKKAFDSSCQYFLKSDSGKFPESVTVENVERDPTKSFFNLFWKGIEQGLKKTLIGKNVEKTEQKVKMQFLSEGNEAVCKRYKTGN